VLLWPFCLCLSFVRHGAPLKGKALALLPSIKIGCNFFRFYGRNLFTLFKLDRSLVVNIFSGYCKCSSLLQNTSMWSIHYQKWLTMTNTLAYYNTVQSNKFFNMEAYYNMAEITVVKCLSVQGLAEGVWLFKIKI